MPRHRERTKSISSLVDLSWNTVKKYINTFNQCGKSLEVILTMDEDELLRLFNEKSAPLSSPVHVGPVYGTQEGLQHSHVEGLPKFIVEVD